jgi:hypothetical protein
MKENFHNLSSMYMALGRRFEVRVSWHFMAIGSLLLLVLLQLRWVLRLEMADHLYMYETFMNIIVERR